MSALIARRSFVAGLITSPFIFSPPSYAKDWCPNENTTGVNDYNNSVQISPYSFEFKSWSWKDRDWDQFVACHCIRNNSVDASLFYDWKSTGMMGWIPPTLTSQSVSSSPENNFHEVDSKLWFGSAPAEKDARTTVRNGQSGSINGGAGKIVPVGLNLLKTAETDTKDHRYDKIYSSSRIFVPNMSLLGELRDIAQIRTIVETTPAVLKQFDMDFVSTVQDDDKGANVVELTCNYSIRGPRNSRAPTLEGDEMFEMGFGNELLNNTLLGNRDRRGIMSSWDRPNVEFVLEGKFSASPEAAKSIRQSFMSLYVPQTNIELVRLPISYHSS